MKILIMLLLCSSSVLCRTIETKIVGGNTAKDGEFPYLVSIRNKGVHNCGGAILNNNWILTAAHCLIGKQASKLTIVAGTNYLNEGGDFYNVSKIISHGLFSTFKRCNDIGLIKIDRPIEFSDKVRSVLLSSEKDEKLLPGLSLTLAGWGRLEEDTEPSNDLQKIQLKLISNTKCRLQNFPYSIWNSNICTLNKEGQGACNGDSGGPLVYNNRIIGIVSWGTPCAVGKPDVFTKVSSYLNWIRMKID